MRNSTTQVPGVSSSRFIKLLASAVFWLGLALSLPAAAVDLFDDFNRADSATLGNGWIEKNPAAFSLAGNRVTKLGVSTGFHNNLAYRPANEDLRDAEASVEFRWLSGSIGYPQVLVRLQPGTVANANVLDGYILFINNSSSQAVLRRQQGTGFTFFTTINFAPALNMADTYRLRLRATGVNPVTLNAFIERQNGGGWDILGQSTYNDSSTGRFSTPGAVGFSGFTESSYAFDNFRRVDLEGGTPPADNPVPATTSLTPAAATAGSGALTLTVNGSNFIAGSTVRWNGADRATTFISATQLEAAISGADLANTGNATVTVFNPTPGGGLSNGQTFTINEAAGNPIPVTSGLAPAAATEGGSAFSLNVQGSGFVPGAIVRWNGANRTTNYISATQLSAAIPDTDIASPGSATITVLNPAPGGGISNSQTFTINPLVINNPVPAISGLNPSAITEGSGAFTLQINGSGFIAGSVVSWNGDDRTTTFISASQLNVAISAADVAAAGVANATVFNPAPGGGLSNTANFTINASIPTTNQILNEISPRSATINSGNTALTAYGNGFTNDSVMQFDGIALSTTYISATQLSATIPGSLLSEVSRSAVTVYTPTASNTLTAPAPFFVMEDGDTLFFDDFNRANSANLGNGWTEKYPAAFSLVNGEITSIETTPRGYNNVITYRPEAQDGRDVEVGVEFVRSPSSDPRFPQVHARILRGTVNEPDTLLSYTAFLYDDNPNTLTVTTILDFQECYLAQFPLTRALALDNRYRLRFRVLGSNPIRMTAYLDHFNQGEWEIISTGSIEHSDSTQPTPGLWCTIGYMPSPSTYAYSGAVGFAKYIYQTDRYDNFYSIQLANDSNEIPVLTSTMPASANAGSNGFPLTVNGSGFIPGAVVRWNGVDQTTTYLSASSLQIQVSAAQIASVGSADVTVFNPPPGGGVSSPLTFFITQTGGDFIDDFSRPNNTALGNGWIEKSPAAFSLINGEAEKQGVSTGYRDNLVYRPASENSLNVESSVEFRYVSAIWDYPQVFARVQTDTANISNYLDGYILYINNSNSQGILGRQRGTSFVEPLATVYLTTQLNTTSRYRMRLRATGTSPVQLNAFIERQTETGWTTIGQASAFDNNVARIDTAGSTGFSGYVGDTYRMDNFTRTALPQ